MLFVFSAASYGTDFLEHGFFRWGLILLFMFLKAGFIVAIFMHMAWERLALIYAILGPPVVLLVLVGLMAIEGDYTELTRLDFFSEPIAPPGHEARKPRTSGAFAAYQSAKTPCVVVDRHRGFRALWGRLWQSQPKAAFGVLIGLPLAWILSRAHYTLFDRYGRNPRWLPPLPFATVAVTLLVVGGCSGFAPTGSRRRSGRSTTIITGGHSGQGHH